MRTLNPADITTDMLPCLCTRGHADGTVTLYYEGDDVPPMPQAPLPPPSNFVTPDVFRSLFTTPELLAMLGSADPQVKLLVLKVSTPPPEGIDLLSPEVSAGLDYLTAQNILSPGRAAAIKAEQPPT